MGYNLDLKMGYIGVITHIGFGAPGFWKDLKTSFAGPFFCWATKNVKKLSVLLGCFLLLARLKSWKKCESLVFIVFLGEFAVRSDFASLVSCVTIFLLPS